MSQQATYRKSELHPKCHRPNDESACEDAHTEILYMHTVNSHPTMSKALILAVLQPGNSVLTFFDGRVPAGFPSPALDHMEQKLSLDTLLGLQAPHTYVVAVSGDSMTGAGIFDGDHLIVSRAIPARPGHVVVACLNGDVLVKRLAQEQGQFILRSENPAYSPRYILESDELMIWGVVTHSLRNHLAHA